MNQKTSQQDVPESLEVVVIGGGQSGIATSEHLSRCGVSHMVLERDRIAEKWRSGRWDSMHANGPAWHDCFPNMSFDTETVSGAEAVDPDDFPSKDRVAQYLEDYSGTFNSPIRTQTEVLSVSKQEADTGYLIRCRNTSDGSVFDIVSQYVVSCTGSFQTPVIPPVISEDVERRCGISQLHSAEYNNPDELREGAVLVVGAGASGVQIADELNKSGKEVILAVGEHDRPPRRYRDRDYVWWFGVLGHYELVTPRAGAEHVTHAVTGAEGGFTVDFRDLSSRGVRLAGRAESCDANGVVHFRDDLASNLEGGDRYYLELLADADAYVDANGLDLPEEPEAWRLGPTPRDAVEPIEQIDLAAAGVTTVIWATGYGLDYSWLNVDGALDESGRPVHQRGVSPINGLFYVGLPWLSRRGSSFIWGCWHDAKHVVDQIDIQRKYASYLPDWQVNAEASSS